MARDRVRFGLVGYGLFGKHHARVIAQCELAELVAIAVPSESSRQAARRDFPRLEVYADHRDLLSREEIEVLSVVAPNETHYDIGRAVLGAGKHLLLEKPMALQIEHCTELVDLAAAKQRILAVGHELRLSSLWGRVKKLIDLGTIGVPQHALIELTRFPYRPGSGGWRYDLERVGSWVLEEPIHFFDLARWYLAAGGEPVSIYARASSRQGASPRLFDHFSAIVSFPSANAVVAQTLAAFGHHQTVKVSGTEGTIWAWWSAADARSEHPAFGLRYGLGDQIHEVTIDKPAGELLELADEIAAVAAAVRDGTAPPCTGIDGWWSTLLCLAAERSVQLGEAVSLGQFAQLPKEED